MLSSQQTGAIYRLEEIKELHDSLILQLNQIPEAKTDVDVDWLSGTNISLPQQVSSYNTHYTGI